MAAAAGREESSVLVYVPEDTGHGRRLVERAQREKTEVCVTGSNEVSGVIDERRGASDVGEWMLLEVQVFGKARRESWICEALIGRIPWLVHRSFLAATYVPRQQTSRPSVCNGQHTFIRTHGSDFWYLRHPVGALDLLESYTTAKHQQHIMAPADSTTNSGIKKLSNGDSVIPSSTRADGSVRKEIRVKPGYKPPEDVEVYKNRTAEAWKNRGKGGVPGAQLVEADESAPSAAANKNAKRREARKKAAAAVAEVEPSADGRHEADGEQNGGPPEEADPEAAKAKEARKLAKKIRQARELKEKKDNGADLLPDQFAKVIKINELIRQLDNLGFDAEGERKDAAENTERAAD